MRIVGARRGFTGKHETMKLSLSVTDMNLLSILLHLFFVRMMLFPKMLLVINSVIVMVNSVLTPRSTSFVLCYRRFDFRNISNYGSFYCCLLHGAGVGVIEHVAVSTLTPRLITLPI